MNGKYGFYEASGLDGLRTKYPIVDGVQNDPAMIPFSSDIKFNLIIRDMDKANKRPTNKADNMTIYIKGAPERILNRCKFVMVEEQDKVFDQSCIDETDAANDKFGGMGERVLAFARCQLDPAQYTKDPKYMFDVKKWKTWREVREFDDTIQGWFPMYDFTLVGLVSLNDPPRPKVDISVKKC
jgi:sodium/potassium-transporting ATPase subunit alpha